jgi:hypothetical protein
MAMAGHGSRATVRFVALEPSGRWRALAWCLAIAGEPQVEVGLQIFGRRVTAQAKRALAKKLASYKTLTAIPETVFMHKLVHRLDEARRERRWLDSIIRP